MSRTLIAFSGALTLLCASAAAGTAGAHHSYAMFDNAVTLDVSATVEKWEWTNPHSFLEIVEAGTGKHWSLESASPSMLSRQGLSRVSFKPGDKVIVKLHPRRDKAPVGSLMSVVMPDGKNVQFEGGRGGPAAAAN